MTVCRQTALQLEDLGISCHVGNDLPSWSVLEPLNPSHLQRLCSVKQLDSLKVKRKNGEFLQRDKQGITSLLLIQHLVVMFLPLAQCRVGDCSRRKWWRGGCRNGGQTYRWRMRCYWSQAWGCSSQSHRNTASLLGCTCSHTYKNNLRLSINTITPRHCLLLHVPL